MPLSVRTPPVHLTRMISTACERDESAFIFVHDTHSEETSKSVERLGHDATVYFSEPVGEAVVADAAARAGGRADPMISAFARAGLVFGDERYVVAAVRAAAFILDEMWEDGVLRRVYQGGRADGPAFLEDYAFLIAGLLDLYEVDTQPRWLRAAIALRQLGQPGLEILAAVQAGDDRYAREMANYILGLSAAAVADYAA